MELGFGKTISSSNKITDSEVVVKTDKDLVWISTES